MADVSLHELIDARTRTLAPAYRRLVVWVGVQLALNAGALGLYIMPVGAGRSALVQLLCLGWVASVVAVGYYGYVTAAGSGAELPWVWAVTMLVPYVNLIALLTLSSRATRLCRAHGIPVGFFGPKVRPAARNPSEAA